MARDLTFDQQMLLNSLIVNLQAAMEKAISEKPQYNDAISDVLNTPIRTTGIISLREHATIKKFGAELAAGKMQNDTILQVMGLVNVAIKALL